MTGKTGRRGHNEGAIYQRPDGRWVGAVHLGWSGGKRKRKVVYGKTRAEVSQKVTRIKSDMQKGLPIATASPTVAAFLDEWMTEIVVRSTTAGTADAYRSIVTRHLKPALGKHKLEKLTQQQVQAMFSSEAAAGTSASMVKQIRSVLRTALSQAMRWDLVHRNVATLATPPKADAYEGYAISPDEVRAIMAAVKGTDLDALYAIATSVGLRQGELLGLRWIDVDLEGASIHIRKQLQVIDRTPTLIDPKSRHSRRTVPLVGPVLASVKAHRKRQIARFLERGTPWTDQAFVFANPDGSPLSSTALRSNWYATRKQAGMPDTVRFHDLRHGALTILATRGTLPRTLMGIAGHSNITTTMQIYAHLDLENVRTSVDLMADLYGAETEAS